MHSLVKFPLMIRLHSEKVHFSLEQLPPEICSRNKGTDPLRADFLPLHREQSSLLFHPSFELAPPNIVKMGLTVATTYF